jgi:hypothetical protein
MVNSLECTSSSLGATSLWPASLPKAIEYQLKNQSSIVTDPGLWKQIMSCDNRLETNVSSDIMSDVGQDMIAAAHQPGNTHLSTQHICLYIQRIQFNSSHLLKSDD